MPCVAILYQVISWFDCSRSWAVTVYNTAHEAASFPVHTLGHRKPYCLLKCSMDLDPYYPVPKVKKNRVAWTNVDHSGAGVEGGNRKWYLEAHKSWGGPQDGAICVWTDLTCLVPSDSSLQLSRQIWAWSSKGMRVAQWTGQGSLCLCIGPFPRYHPPGPPGPSTEPPSYPLLLSLILWASTTELKYEPVLLLCACSKAWATHLLWWFLWWSTFKTVHFEAWVLSSCVASLAGTMAFPFHLTS